MIKKETGFVNLFIVRLKLTSKVPINNADKVMEKMKDTMEQTVELNIPLIAEAAIGSNWNEAH